LPSGFVNCAADYTAPFRLARTLRNRLKQKLAGSFLLANAHVASCGWLGIHEAHLQAFGFWVGTITIGSGNCQRRILRPPISRSESLRSVFLDGVKREIDRPSRPRFRFPKWACHRRRNERNCADQMKTNRKYAAEQGMEAMFNEFLDKGAEVCMKV
jgi:hypothetical protein